MPCKARVVLGDKIIADEIMEKTTLQLKATLQTLDEDGLRHFQDLQAAAVSAVTERFYAVHGAIYEGLGKSGRDSLREELAFHLEFLRPVLEFGIRNPMLEYLRWLHEVLTTRNIPTQHLPLSLDWFAEFFSEHMVPAEGRVVVEALQAVRAEFMSTAKAPVVLEPPTPWPEVSGLVEALLRGDQRAAQALMDRCLDEGRNLVDVEVHLLQPALYRIGEGWQANQVSVAQEHMASAIVQLLMTCGLLRSTPPEPIGKRILLACVEGNAHAVGLRMVADAFLLSGWDIQYLGADVPTPELVKQVIAWQPDLIGLSVSFPQQLRIVKDVTEQLKAQMGGRSPPIMVGGLAVNRFQQLTEALGVDARGRDAQAAVGCAQSLIRN